MLLEGDASTFFFRGDDGGAFGFLGVVGGFDGAGFAFTGDSTLIFFASGAVEV